MTRPAFVAPGVVTAFCPKPTSHTGVVVMVAAKGDGVVVLDSGMADRMPGALGPALDLLGATTADVRAVLSTHGHRDHTGGSRALRDASGALTFFSADDEALAGFAPDVPVADGDVISSGDLRFEVVTTPGHTAGSVCFYEPTLKLLVAGDGVQGVGSARKLPVYYESGTRYRASLRKLLTLEIDTLVVGHPLAWRGANTHVFTGAQCHELLEDSYAAAEVIRAAVASVVTSVGAHPAPHRAALAVLATSPIFDHFDPGDPVEEDTEATLDSELRDLAGTAVR